jgi:hypothetical protein
MIETSTVEEHLGMCSSGAGLGLAKYSDVEEEAITRLWSRRVLIFNV